MSLRLVVVDGPLLSREQTAAIVAAHTDLGVSETGLVRRVVAVAECGLCGTTHPSDHMCEAKFGALLKQAANQITTSDRSLAKIRSQLDKPPRTRADRSR